MAKTIEELQEEINKIKSSIRECKHDIARYEDYLDVESYYRRDYEKEEKYNEICDHLTAEVDELEAKLTQLEELLTLKVRREKLREKIAELNDQAKKLEIKSPEYGSIFLEICACEQDLKYAENIIKKKEKTIYIDNNKK